MTDTRSKTRYALRLAREPTHSIRQCVMQCVVLATVPRGGGKPGCWYIDPPVWRERCVALLGEGQAPPTVVSVDVEIASDLLEIGDIYEETDVGTGRRLTPRAKRSLQRTLFLLLVVLAIMYGFHFWAGRSVPPNLWFWWGLIPTVFSFRAAKRLCRVI